jgi:hypothetical protein
MIKRAVPTCPEPFWTHREAPGRARSRHNAWKRDRQRFLDIRDLAERLAVGTLDRAVESHVRLLTTKLNGPDRRLATLMISFC